MYTRGKNTVSKTAIIYEFRTVEKQNNLVEPSTQIRCAGTRASAHPHAVHSPQKFAYYALSKGTTSNNGGQFSISYASDVYPSSLAKNQTAL